MRVFNYYLNWKKKEEIGWSAYHLPSDNPRHECSKDNPEVLGRVPPRETGLTTVPLSSSPHHWVSLEEEITHVCSLWIIRQTSIRSNSSEEEVMSHWCDHDPYPDLTWWREDYIYSTDPACDAFDGAKKIEIF